MPLVDLEKLFYDSPGISPAKVQKVLDGIFESTTIEARNEPLFTFQIRCEGANRKTQLIVRYGWSDNHSRWFFEPLEVPNVDSCV